MNFEPKVYVQMVESNDTEQIKALTDEIFA
jgi:hypothetical protein